MKKDDKDIIIVPFKNITEVSQDLIGRKAANLSEIISLKLPIPQGFVITTNAFDYQLQISKLNTLIANELSDLDAGDNVRVENASKKIRSNILNMDLDNQLKDMFQKAYSSLSGFSDSYVALRSSSPVFDIENESISNSYSTYLNVRGKSDVVEKILFCWASMFTPQNIFTLLSKSIDLNNVSIAVIVQKMIQSEVSGILFTVNPIDNDGEKMSIECVLGLGESLMKGELNPDNYLLDKKSSKVLEKKIVPQEWMLVRKGKIKKGEDPNIKVNVSNIWKVKQKLDNKYIAKLVKIGKKIEDKLNEPQEVEWVYEGGKIWIMQVRPLTKLKVQDESWKETPTYAQLRTKVESSEKPKEGKEEIKTLTMNQQKNIAPKSSKIEQDIVLLNGRGVHEGVVSGTVKIINNVKEIRNIEKGTILVAEKLTTAFDNKLTNVVGMIADQSTRDSYGLILAKSLGIPCIVDAQIATKVLRNSEEVTIDGKQGNVVAGSSDKGKTNANEILNKQVLINQSVKEEKPSAGKKEEKREKEEEVLRTATKVYVNISDPNKAPDISSLYVDGVGRLSGGDIIKDKGIHPKTALKTNNDKKDLQEALILGIYRVARSFEPKPLIYRLSDLSSDEYRKLKGGEKYERKNNNPLLGQRGASRFIENNDELELELEALKVIRNKENIKNVWLEIPFVRTYKELKEMKQLISGFGFRRSSTFRLYFTVAVPSTIVRIEKLLELGFDGVVIDLDLLSQFMLSVDNSNPKLDNYWKGIHLSILWAVEKVVKVCNKKKVNTLVVGKFLSNNSKLISKLVDIGVSSISVDKDLVYETRKAVYEEEAKVLNRKRRK